MKGLGDGNMKLGNAIDNALNGMLGGGGNLLHAIKRIWGLDGEFVADQQFSGQHYQPFPEHWQPLIGAAGEQTNDLPAAEEMARSVALDGITNVLSGELAPGNFHEWWKDQFAKEAGIQPTPPKPASANQPSTQPYLVARQTGARPTENVGGLSALTSPTQISSLNTPSMGMKSLLPSPSLIFNPQTYYQNVQDDYQKALDLLINGKVTDANDLLGKRVENIKQILPSLKNNKSLTSYLKRFLERYAAGQLPGGRDKYHENYFTQLAQFNVLEETDPAKVKDKTTLAKYNGEYLRTNERNLLQLKSKAPASSAGSFYNSKRELKSESILDVANNWVKNKSYLKYKMGGTGKNSTMDCSKFVHEVLKEAIGFSGGSTSATLMQDPGLETRPFVDLKPGDILVRLDNSKTEKYEGHVMIYAGGNEVIDMSNSQNGIRRHSRPLNELKKYTVRRVR